MQNAMFLKIELILSIIIIIECEEDVSSNQKDHKTSNIFLCLKESEQQENWRTAYPKNKGGIIVRINFLEVNSPDSTICNRILQYIHQLIIFMVEQMIDDGVVKHLNIPDRPYKKYNCLVKKCTVVFYYVEESWKDDALNKDDKERLLISGQKLSYCISSVMNYLADASSLVLDLHSRATEVPVSGLSPMIVACNEENDYAQKLGIIDEEIFSESQPVEFVDLNSTLISPLLDIYETTDFSCFLFTTNYLKAYVDNIMNSR